MLRRIIKIDQDKCNGCGLCVTACHEGAIGLENGKAVLLRDDYCDGLGDCLPACPTQAISFETREALAYDEAAVLRNMAAKQPVQAQPQPLTPCMRPISTRDHQWPYQLKLLPTQSPLYDNADLLIAADCSAFALPDFKRLFMEGKTTLIACPKLDNTDYSQKLAEIFRLNPIRSVLAVRMEVPCCGGLISMVQKGLELSGKDLELRTVILSTDGRIL